MNLDKLIAMQSEYETGCEEYFNTHIKPLIDKSKSRQEALELIEAHRLKVGFTDTMPSAIVVSIAIETSRFITEEQS